MKQEMIHLVNKEINSKGKEYTRKDGKMYTHHITDDIFNRSYWEVFNETHKDRAKLEACSG